MISVKNLGFVYKNSKTAALDDINIEIADGDFVGITGTSGAGKTTFTFALNGIIPQKIKGDFYGAVTIDGVDTAEHPAEEFARTVGEVFQDIDSQMVASVVEDFAAQVKLPMIKNFEYGHFKDRHVLTCGVRYRFDADNCVLEQV